MQYDKWEWFWNSRPSWFLSLRSAYPQGIPAGYLLHPGIRKATFTAAVMLNCRRGNAGPVMCGYPAMVWANARKRLASRFVFFKYWIFILVLREPALICQDGPSWLSNLDVCVRTGFAELWLCRKVQFSEGFAASCRKFVSKLGLC